GRGITAVALASRFWGLGCPKIFHEVATRLLNLRLGIVILCRLRYTPAPSHPISMKRLTVSHPPE
ncbi:MAG: hypothetical protein KZQ65_09995, partial [Candidatus Thiodiazotropha sp. (ex Gloverina cf. vestifex)]|nr:hypothetical protein [Candidatus Thiodiazotropha sp. (ex Gloverina cf. vestifex)]